MVTLSVLVVSNLKIDLIVMTNVVIAVSTATAATAAIIHFDSIRKQRKDRIWEINKTHLLEMSKSLFNVIEITRSEMEFEFEKIQEISSEKPKDDHSEKYKKFSESLHDLLNVYEPMLSDEIPKAIKVYLDKIESINLDYHNNRITNLFEVYDNVLFHQMELHKVLSDYIKNLAGTKIYNFN
ncbi:MAG: hypothetical protein ACPGUE_17190 [Marinomonas sp.]